MSRLPRETKAGLPVALLLFAFLSAVPGLAADTPTEFPASEGSDPPAETSPGAGHSEAITGEAITGEPITVWATAVSSSSVGSNDEEIALKQVDHLSDLLREIPGVDIGGTHSTNQRINIRGLGDRNLRVTLDGAVQNNYMFHHMGNLLLNTDVLKAVDVRVGAGSVVDGGLGGAVRFETKDARDLLAPGQVFGGRVQGLYNSNASVGTGVTLYSRLSETVDLMAYAQRVDRDDFEDGEGVASSGNDGTTDNLLLALGIDLAEGHRLELSFDDLGDEGVYAPRPDFNGAANDRINDARGGHPYPTAYGRQTATVRYEGTLGGSFFGGNTVLRSSLYDNDSELVRDQDGTEVFGSAINRGLDATFFTSLERGGTRHELTWGTTANRQESRYGEDGVETARERATAAAVFVEDRIVLSERFTLTPGLRFDRFSMDTASTDETFDEVSGALSLEWAATKAWTVRLSGTEVSKGPELAEIFIGGGGRKIPNPDLRPESGLDTELGLRYEKKGIFGLDRLGANLTIFRTDIDDYIESVGVAEGCVVGARCSQDRNVGTVELDGFEAGIDLVRGSFAGRLTYASSSSEVVETGEPLEREVGDSISVSVAWGFDDPDLELRWTSRVVFEEDDVITGNLVKDGYDVHDVAVRWSLHRTLAGLDVTVGVDNLFDEHYASHASRFTFDPAFGDLTDFEPGRNFKTTLSYAF